MTDLLSTLPDFPTRSYTHLIPSLEKNLITTTDLLTLDALEIAKRAQLPILDVRKLATHVVQALHDDLGFRVSGGDASYNATVSTAQSPLSSHTQESGRDIVNRWRTISTLDSALDKALAGGIPVGYLTEVTGERSGFGRLC